MSKSLYFIFFSCLGLLLGIPLSYSQSQEDDLKTALRNSDLVCIGTVIEIVDNYKGEANVIVQIEKQWKGESKIRIHSSLQVKLTLRNTTFQEGETYLLFASMSIDLHSYSYPTYLLQANSIIKLASQAQEEIAHLNLIVTCMDKNSINPERPCERIYIPVCGCDQVTYDNVCEAQNNGIAVWTKGKCKERRH